MKNVIIETLKKELAKKQARIDRLEKLMNENHLSPEDAKLMDEFAARFNAAKSGAEKIRIADEWKELNDRWKKSVDKAIHQSDNCKKWSDERFELMLDRNELAREISRMEFYKR